jgi:hypothetical protein
MRCQPRPINKGGKTYGPHAAASHLQAVLKRGFPSGLELLLVLQHAQNLLRITCSVEGRRQPYPSFRQRKPKTIHSPPISTSRSAIPDRSATIPI